MKINRLFIATAIALVWGASPDRASAAATLLINMSDTASNNIISTTYLNEDLYTNVNDSAVGTAVSIDGVTGTVRTVDYWQQNQLATLGQPFGSVFGGSGTLSGTTGKDVQITLNLGSWMTANSFTSYTVTVFYGGSDVDNRNAMLAASGTTINGATDTITLKQFESSNGRWSGTGSSFLLSDSSLSIEKSALATTNNQHQGGIAAVMIHGVPEPSAALLGSLGVLAQLRRRRA